MKVVKSMDELIAERGKLQQNFARMRAENIGPQGMIPEVAKAVLDQLIISRAKVNFEITLRMCAVGAGPDGREVFQQCARFLSDCELLEEEIPF